MSAMVAPLDVSSLLDRPGNWGAGHLRDKPMTAGDGTPKMGSLGDPHPPLEFLETQDWARHWILEANVVW